MYMTCVSSPPAALALHNYANTNIGTIGFYSSYIPSFQKEKKKDSVNWIPVGHGSTFNWFVFNS